MNQASSSNETLLFVTGRLSEASLREVVDRLANKLGFAYEVAVPGIQVAALLHVNLLSRRLQVESHIDRVILPGWVQGDLRVLEEQFGKPFERGPRDLYDLPEYFGLGKRQTVSLDRYSIDILGEINHATQMPLTDVIAAAVSMSSAGADLVDVGCVPGESCPRVGEIVAALKERGLRVSIDSFDQSEVEQAVAAGAELILSCNHSNVDWVTKLGTELVLIPDTPADVDSLDRLIDHVSGVGVPFRIDPILEPIGLGFSASLQRYMDARRRYPDLAMMMGVGNVTELTEVDSAGVNMVLAAICEELGIQSILTTQVINWCRTAVAEFDAARRLTYHAVTRKTIPKHLGSSLVMLRDARLKSQSVESIEAMAASLTDANFRIFAEQTGVHLMNKHGHWSGQQPFEIFDSALQANPGIDAGHAFYLGYEMARAEVARLLGKQYTQDEGISFGLAGQLEGSASVHHKSAFSENPET
ncbi:MAG: DUF6513 domain-containing protein [Fuerstiella sp.]|jgi:dihydropteroate synthase-like protein